MKDQNGDKTRTHIVITEGTMIAHYRIVEKIGAGGMGEVYLAEDMKLKRQVALKFLPSHLAANQTIRARFVREAQTIAKLNHPNIVSVHDVSEFEGRPFYVMELVEGESLHSFAHGKPLPVDLIIEYAIQICQGLGEAHRAGIVHRDIKSANIAVDKQGRVRLLDFGLAAHEGDDRITKTGSTLGTVSYMSPEQVSGRDIDHRSDLFSLGIVLYELIAGRTPFKRDSEGATLRAIIEDYPEPLTRYKADFPDKLQEIVAELLEKDKELRYQSAEGVIADLKRLTYDSQQTGHLRKAAPTPKKRNRVIWVAVLASIVIAVTTVRIFLPTQSDQSVNERYVPMIAVLPFENLGPADDQYFADGITDEITSRLAGITGLGVISRTSAMRYRGGDKNLKEIGEELGVEYVLEGTVRWSKVGGKQRVRITPQLVRVLDDRHLWADNYERDLLEVFAVQADIAAKIVAQMGLTLLEKDQQELAFDLTENADAYEYYLKGLSGIRRMELNDYSAMQESKLNLDRAVELDPNFAQAHAARSIQYSLLAFESKSDDHRRVALRSAKRALELYPGLPRGHQAMGIYYNLVETDYDQALKEFYMARNELHNDPDLLSSIGLVLLRQGKFDEANSNFREAAELDPINPFRHWQMGYSLKISYRFGEAEKALDRALALDPGQVNSHKQKIYLYRSWYGEGEKIKAVLEDALRQTDTLALVSEDWWLMQFMPELPWDSLIDEFQATRRGSMDIEAFYGSLASAYYFRDNMAGARIYADSAKTELEKRLELEPDDAQRTSALAMMSALMGDCDRAAELGQRGKELLPVDKCHW